MAQPGPGVTTGSDPGRVAVAARPARACTCCWPGSPRLLADRHGGGGSTPASTPTGADPLRDPWSGRSPRCPSRRAAPLAVIGWRPWSGSPGRPTPTSADRAVASQAAITLAATAWQRRSPGGGAGGSRRVSRQRGTDGESGIDLRLQPASALTAAGRPPALTRWLTSSAAARSLRRPADLPGAGGGGHRRRRLLAGVRRSRRLPAAELVLHRAGAHVHDRRSRGTCWRWCCSSPSRWR